MQRSLCSGMPIVKMPTSSRWMCGVWLENHSVYSSVPGLNQPILLAVSSKGRGQLNSGTLTLKFDSTRFKVASVRPGTLLSDKGSVVHQVTKDVLRITISDAGKKSLAEAGSLLIVELVPIAIGDSQITLQEAESSFQLVDGLAVKFVASAVKLPVVK